ncbi:PadR family transcriptional regulator [Sporolactobacillus shoreicorticis]|uniref:PadR family transcriptional regulator n=1 Tax=Sporolactobacillus shoreicorticis TaxID=1923877 RepID=A0ABW5S3F8_9BACL|nr:helix-turn-helix transcriptional regulator [Sporolactobacillus shoreicorticis]MCO7125862.1 PadR family transcriptional regulator [Sporolactobacillus shoreicorticis]
MQDRSEIIKSLTQELRRGTIVLSALSQLFKPRYGYSLVAILEEKGVPVDANTLYPLLRRLEKQGLLESHWDTADSRPRKYYKVSASGAEIYERLTKEWRRIAASMEQLVKDREED